MDLFSMVNSIPPYIAIPATFVVIVVIARALSRHRARPRRLRGGVDGVGHIVSVSTYNRRGLSSQGLVTIDLVVEAPGMQPTAIKYKRMIMVPRWPQPGDDVPVSVDPRRPKRCVILWGELPDPVAIGNTRAQQLEADLRAKTRSRDIPPPSSPGYWARPATATTPHPAPSSPTSVTIDGVTHRITSLADLDPSLAQTVRTAWQNANDILSGPAFNTLPAAQQKRLRDSVENLDQLFR